MINNFCICTLTHSTEGRDIALKNTISSIMDNYHGDKFEWFIWINITNAKINEVLEWARETYVDRVHFNIHISEYNLGPGGGINRLNELSKEYEYSFFIEGDWLHVPGRIAGVSRNWIQNSIKFLEKNPEIDQVQLRRYLDDADHRMYTFGWIDHKNVERVENCGDMFYVLKERDYVNTPTLRRMSAYYKKEIFPLKEFGSSTENSKEVKGNPEWGMAEISAWQTKMTGAWLAYGNFVHFEDWPYGQDWSKYEQDNRGCGKFKLRGNVKCKYGFLTPSPAFCILCEKSQDITYIVEHSQKYEKAIREIDQMEVEPDMVGYIEKLESYSVDPAINIRELINLEEHETLKKNWRNPKQ